MAAQPRAAAARAVGLGPPVVFFPLLESNPVLPGHSLPQARRSGADLCLCDLTTHLKGTRRLRHKSTASGLPCSLSGKCEEGGEGSRPSALERLVQPRQLHPRQALLRGTRWGLSPSPTSWEGHAWCTTQDSHFPALAPVSRRTLTRSPLSRAV